MLQADLIDLDELIEYPTNPKLHDLVGLRDAIRDHGFLQRCTINTATGRLLSGHGRRMALTIMRDKGDPPPENIVLDGGRWLVPVDLIAVPEEDEDEIVIALNQLTISGGWDNKKLTAMLQKIEAKNGLNKTGFTKTDLKRLARRAFPPDVQNDKPSVATARQLQQRYGTASGQTWEVVGKQTHAVWCGDSQDQDGVQRLLAGRGRTEAIITDPPFELAPDTIRRIFDPLATRAAVLMGLGWRPYDLPREGWVARLDLVWERVTPGNIPRNTMPVPYHNNILFMTKGFKTRLGWQKPDPKFGSIIRLEEGDQRDYRYGLGYAKPISLFVEMLKGFEWDHWFDPFLGSGASLLACDVLGMTCNGVERDPATLAVLLNRAAESGCEVRCLSGAEAHAGD